MKDFLIFTAAIIAGNLLTDWIRNRIASGRQTGNTADTADTAPLTLADCKDLKQVYEYLKEREYKANGVS
jgi:hypothetical protein